MECERLQKLIKNWYLQVQDESMAPARMVEFMRNHVEDCIVCMGDPLVDDEIARITEIVLPPSKIPKAVRKEEENQKNKSDDDEDESDSDDDGDESEDEDEDEDEDEIDEPDLDDDEDDL